MPVAGEEGNGPSWMARKGAAGPEVVGGWVGRRRVLSMKAVFRRTVMSESLFPNKTQFFKSYNKRDKRHTI